MADNNVCKMELWKDVVGYEGLYKVSNKGRIKSLARRSHKKDLILKPATTWDGYKSVNLYKNKKKSFIKIHRMVAIAFILNPDNKPQINHIDGDKTNNDVDNLEWCTLQENRIHAYKTGLQNPQCGEKNGMAKLSECEVREMREAYNSGSMTIKSLSLKFKVSNQSADNVVKNKTWKNI